MPAIDGERLLLQLHDDGLLQLVNRATARSLAPGLVRLMEYGAPGTEVAEWLIAQPGVVEVFADDSALAGALLSPPREREHASDLELYDGGWHTERQVDLGFGEVTVEVVVDDERDAARIDAALDVLRGAWERLLAPACATYFSDEPLFADAAAAAAAFEGLSLYVHPVGRWGIQLTFDARGMRTTGYFLDFDGDRLIDAAAVD
jgi:hypothetical protein